MMINKNRVTQISDGLPSFSPFVLGWHPPFSETPKYQIYISDLSLAFGP